MRKPATSAALSLAAVCCCGCAEGEDPGTLKECLIEASRRPSGEAIRAAERICREVFEEPAVIPSGSFYYLGNEGVCVEMAIAPDGEVGGSFCSRGGRVEVHGQEDLTFSCLGFNSTEVDRVFDVEQAASSLLLRVRDGYTVTLHSSLGACLGQTADQREEIKEEQGRQRAEEAARRERARILAVREERRRGAGPCCRCLTDASCDGQRAVGWPHDECVSRVVDGDAFDAEGPVDNYCASLWCLDECRGVGLEYRSPYDGK